MHSFGRGSRPPLPLGLASRLSRQTGVGLSATEGRVWRCRAPYEETVMVRGLM